ncbi:MAG: YihY/virulence factor BrkB family protein, partial [Clostridia bacterium]|nr:YihY/virulence factor BrkB family protein [Clostridia bacterium]
MNRSLTKASEAMRTADEKVRGGWQKKLSAYTRSIWHIYNESQIPKASAAMSYYLTMTFFPLIICLYALFGQSYDTAVRLLDYIRRFLTPDAAEMIEKYLVYLSEESGSTITVIAISFLITSASASMRTLISTVNSLQGRHRFGTAVNFILSLLMAVGLLVELYFAFIVLLTGDRLILFLKEYIPRLGIINDWGWAKFLLLGGLTFITLLGIFALLRPRKMKYRVLPGAILSTAAIIITCYFFSVFIAASTRYQVIYGS